MIILNLKKIVETRNIRESIMHSYDRKVAKEYCVNVIDFKRWTLVLSIFVVFLITALFNIDKCITIFSSASMLDCLLAVVDFNIFQILSTWLIFYSFFCIIIEYIAKRLRRKYQGKAYKTVRFSTGYIDEARFNCGELLVLYEVIIISPFLNTVHYTCGAVISLND
jgi:hypothetical protein